MRIVYLVLGWISVGLGVIGIFIPLLPTVPFMLLAALLFSKSSERVHQWLLNQKKIGPMIRDWEENQVIRPKAKLQATLTIAIVFSITLIFVKTSIQVKSLISLVGALVLVFIWTRKNQPENDVDKPQLTHRKSEDPPLSSQ